MRESADGAGSTGPSPVRPPRDPTGAGVPELPAEGRRGTSEILLTELSADRQPVAPETPEPTRSALGGTEADWYPLWPLLAAAGTLDRAERALLNSEFHRVASLLKNAMDNMNRTQMNHLGPGLLLAIETLKTEARNVRGVNPRRHTNNTGPRL